jgi:hypothetical protein
MQGLGRCQAESAAMRTILNLLALLLLAGPLAAQLRSPEAVETNIHDTLSLFEHMGRRSFETRWPGGQAKETYTVQKGGKVSYTKFFPAGNAAVTYQKSPSGAVVYEKKYGDGKDAVVIKRDERIVDYTSYWPNGQKKGKYQKNFQTRDRFYLAYDADGNQVYPKPK